MKTNTLQNYLLEQTKNKSSSVLKTFWSKSRNRTITMICLAISIYGITAGIGLPNAIRIYNENIKEAESSAIKQGEHYFIRITDTIGSTRPRTEYFTGEMGKNSFGLRINVGGNSTATITSNEFDSKIKNLQKGVEKIINLKIQSNYPSFNNTIETMSIKLLEIIDREEDDSSLTLEDGDYALFDYKGLKDGLAFDGGTASYTSLKIGSGRFIEGFESQMIGMKEGERKDLNVTFPANYSSASLAGKAVIFKVFLRDIVKAADL